LILEQPHQFGLQTSTTGVHLQRDDYRIRRDKVNRRPRSKQLAGQLWPNTRPIDKLGFRNHPEYNAA